MNVNIFSKQKEARSHAIRVFAKWILTTTCLCLLAVVSPAHAAVIGYVPSTTFGGLDGASGFDALFAGAGHTLQAVNLSNAAQVGAVDALWIHGGSFSLTATEQANMTAFLTAGHNVVYITDRSDGGPWAVSTPSVLGPIGGAHIITGGNNAIHPTVGTHELVAGVTDIRFNTWSAVNPGVASPTLLTGNGMAAVYGFGLAELLFIGDTNWQNGFIGANNTGGADNVAFAANIVEWIVDSVIEVAIDIKFCSEPNAFNCKKNGVLPVTIFGTDTFDIANIDISTLRLCTEDLSVCTEAPRTYSIADRGDPTSDLGAAQCALLEVEEGIFEEQDYLNPDGFLDLDAAFEASEVQEMLGTFCGSARNAVSETLVITGLTLDGTMILSVPIGNTGTDQLVKKN